MRGLLAVLLLCLPGIAVAQGMSYPALVDVARVAADDVLNIRATPDAGAEIVGTLSPDRAGVEVIEASPDGKWGRVNAGEGTGWISLAFVDAQPEQDGFPAIHACLGTEPFWGIWQEAGGWLYSSPSGPDYSLTETWRDTASGRLDRYGVVMSWDHVTAHASVRREVCSDGMSDRLFGLSVDMILTEDGEYRMLTGCCTLSGD